MPSSTAPPWSIPYPVGTDPVASGDDAMKNLADRVHLLLTNNLKTSAIQGVPCPLGSGWTGTVGVDLRSGWACVYGAPAKSSWSAGELVATVPSGYRPAQNIYFVGGNSATGAPMLGYVTNTGTVLLSLAGSSGVSFTVVYPVW